MGNAWFVHGFVRSYDGRSLGSGGDRAGIGYSVFGSEVRWGDVFGLSRLEGIHVCAASVDGERWRKRDGCSEAVSSRYHYEHYKPEGIDVLSRVSPSVRRSDQGIASHADVFAWRFVYANDTRRVWRGRRYGWTVGARAQALATSAGNHEPLGGYCVFGIGSENRDQRREVIRGR